MRWRSLLSLTPLVLLVRVVAQIEWPDLGIFELLLDQLRQLAEPFDLVDILATTVTIHPNPPVTEIHRLTLAVAILSAVVVVAITGLYHIFSIEIGVPYEEIREILPRLVIALAFAAVSLPILQVLADVANILVQTFRPPAGLNVDQLVGLTTGLVVVGFINTLLLLALILLFVFRNVYLVFIAAVSPLVAVGWSLPNTRPYAESFTSMWFALLASAPADMLVLRFSLAMLEGSGAFGLQEETNWILGLASFALMLWIPYQLYAVSQGLVGGRGLASQIGESWRRKRPPNGGSGGAGGMDDGEPRRDRRRRRRDRDRDRGRW